MLFGLLLVRPDEIFAQQAKKGIASYYADKFNGRKTSTGEIFSNENLTAASNQFPLGSKVKVTNLLNGKTIIVYINDRMHAQNKRLIDLTKRAAKELDMIKAGLCKVSVELILSK